MIDTNELRRLAQEATTGPWKILPIGGGRKKLAVADSDFLSLLTITDEGDATFGTVYDDADAKFIAAANPSAISELLNRLESAESDCLEQARLNGMGASREAALMAKLEVVEKERDALRTEIQQLRKEADKFDDGIDWIQRALQAEAEAEAMKRQAPVAWARKTEVNP